MTKYVLSGSAIASVSKRILPESPEAAVVQFANPDLPEY